MIRESASAGFFNQVPGSGRNAAAVRRFGTDLLSVRIDLDA